MSARRLAGFAIITLVVAVLFGATAITAGIVGALITWGIALGFAAILIIGISLAVD